MNVMEMFSLKGKVAVVTGGAGLYGRQIAEALAEAGAKTFMASRDQVKLEEQAKKFRAAGLDVTALSVDQGDEQSVKDLLAEVLKRAGKVNVLINNAVLRPMKDWTDTAEAFARSMQVNATGVFSMTRYFGDHMAANGGGSIVNVGSIQGVIGPDYTLYEGLGWGMPPDYFFHKGGLMQLTRFAASKLGPQNVRVNIINPGGFFNNQDERFLKRYNQRTFLGRMADDKDLKGVIVFLASDASSYITGADIAVDGGYTAK
ncbi:MAG: SDR family oxidoreductase [Phycisphaerales bacterium]|jgi:NAD(P)-dependent dehydrogenase (short-subunit alcohol dehydrogenase family)|nr:SDR family oxidoreductase [Phycisphaerales bacterium]